jgi:hypothetical protein
MVSRTDKKKMHGRKKLMRESAAVREISSTCKKV